MSLESAEALVLLLTLRAPPVERQPVAAAALSEVGAGVVHARLVVLLAFRVLRVPFRVLRVLLAGRVVLPVVSIPKGFNSRERLINFHLSSHAQAQRLQRHRHRGVLQHGDHRPSSCRGGVAVRPCGCVSRPSSHVTSPRWDCTVVLRTRMLSRCGRVDGSGCVRVSRLVRGRGKRTAAGQVVR